MPSLDAARLLILKRASRLPAETVTLADSLHRITAEPIIAGANVPPFDNSAMDGFAVRAADCIPNASLTVTGYVAAGCDAPPDFQPGTAIRIMTGAPIPSGCDAVMPFEQTQATGDQICAAVAVRPGQHIRYSGEDILAGKIAIPANTVIRPIEVSMLASLNRAQVLVYRRPVVAIVSTGDELVELGQTPSSGKIVNSNTHALAAAITEAGATPKIIGTASDTLKSHHDILRRGLEADALITSAGVSAGDRDLVRTALVDLGVELLFTGVAVKPGSPTAFGTVNDKLVFCLPGNPVAALLMFEIFVRPAILKLGGHPRPLQRLVLATLQSDVSKRTASSQLLRVKLTLEAGRLTAHSAGNQNTGMFSTLLNADGVAILASDRTHYAAGEQVEVLVLSDKLHAYAPEPLDTVE